MILTPVHQFAMRMQVSLVFYILYFHVTCTLFKELFDFFIYHLVNMKEALLCQEHN